MKTKAIELLIAAAVVAVIVGVAFCFAGCKDKAEAYEPNDLKIDWGGINEPNDITTITLPDPNAAVEFIEMDEPLIKISSEHEYPLTANIVGENGVDREVTFEIIDDEIVCSTTAREAVEILYLCLCQSFGQESIDYGKSLPFRFAEPNDPDTMLNIEFADDDAYENLFNLDDTGEPEW